jgi:hypothetical protein
VLLLDGVSLHLLDALKWNRRRLSIKNYGSLSLHLSDALQQHCYPPAMSGMDDYLAVALVQCTSTANCSSKSMTHAIKIAVFLLPLAKAHHLS